MVDKKQIAQRVYDQTVSGEYKWRVKDVTTLNRESKVAAYTCTISRVSTVTYLTVRDELVISNGDEQFIVKEVIDLLPSDMEDEILQSLNDTPPAWVAEALWPDGQGS